VVYQGDDGAVEQLCTILSQESMATSSTRYSFDPYFSNSSYFPGQQYASWNAATPWKTWPQQPTQNHPWKQGLVRAWLRDYASYPYPPQSQYPMHPQ
jgi:hypothetical protein